MHPEEGFFLPKAGLMGHRNSYTHIPAKTPISANKYGFFSLKIAVFVSVIYLNHKAFKRIFLKEVSCLPMLGTVSSDGDRQPVKVDQDPGPD